MKRLYVLFLLTLLLCNSSLRGQTIAFSELNFNSDSTTTSGDWVELYNYGSASLDISNWFLKDDDDMHLFKIPDNTVLPAGGREVIINDSAKFTSAHPFVTNFLGTFTFKFGNDGDQVRLFDNNGTIKLFMQYADSTPWYKAADGTGRTLENSNPSGDPNDPANWFVGCMGGSPGAAFSPCNDPIVFSEINYHSDSLLDAGDWCEIWNHSSGNINLNGWSFKDSKDSNIFFFPNNINLAPDARLVLVHDTALFFQRHPNVTNWVGPFNFNLSNGGELIRLFDYNGKIKFSIVYNDHNGWPSGADGDGYTLELLDPSQNMNDPADWFDGCLEGSPGVAYDPTCPTGTELIKNSSLKILNSLADNSVIIEIPENDFQSSCQLKIFDALGRLVKSSVLNSTTSIIDVSDFSAGIYIAEIKTQSLLLTGKFIVQ